MNKIRKWINKDDGKYYQIGNYSLTWLESIGAFIAIAGMVIWTAADKVKLESIIKYFGIASILFGMILFYFGANKNKRK